MDSNVYLAHTLSEIIGPCKKRKHWHAYNVKRIQRFFLHTIAAFFLQYLMVIHLPHTFPGLPIYPPIGTAFVLFYFLGGNAVYGLFLGGFFAYLANGWALLPLFLYLTADIGCGYVGARISRGIFSSDKSVLVSDVEWIKFIKINGFTTCFVSSLLRIAAIMLNYTGSMPSKMMLYGWLDLWLADLNSIMVFAAFFLSWISVYLRREKITHGFLLASALSYVGTLLFLAWLILHQQQCLGYLSIQKYTIIPLLLVIFTMVMLYLGQKIGRDYPNYYQLER